MAKTTQQLLPGLECFEENRVTSFYGFLPSKEELQDQLTCLAELRDSNKVFAKLKAIDWSFTKEDTSYLSHDIHPYPAKFIPQIPRNLIIHLSLPGEMICDPFGGCGTTALEAILLGRCAISSDINPLAQVIGEAKTLTLTKEDDEVISDFIEQLLSLCSKPESLDREVYKRRQHAIAYVPEVPNLNEWFHPNAITELAYLRWRIENLESHKSRILARASFSKSILKASYQDGETRYARRQRDILPGSVIRLFAGNLSSALAKVHQLGPLLKFRKANFKTIDLRIELVSDSQDSARDRLRQNSIDLIVTSPPYPNTTDYHLYHRFRLFWLGYDPRDFGKSEIGSHLRHQKEATGFSDYIHEMSLCLGNMFKVLRPGRYAVLVLGDGIFSGKLYRTSEEIADAAKEAGFEIVGVINRKVHSTKRSFISPARRIRSEQLVLLRKPPGRITLTLLEPPYKLWSYEERLRQREIEILTGHRPSPSRDGKCTIQTSSLALDKIRKLTFTHGFYASKISPELTWQAILENGEAPKIKRQRKDPKYATHGIHPYKGKFYPQLAKSLFNLCKLESGQHVLDPFCGSGTVLLESYLNGLKAFGIDLNVLAVKIARVKTEILDVDPYLRDRILSRFIDRLNGREGTKGRTCMFPDGIKDELVSWFPKPVLTKLEWLFHEIEQVSEPRLRELLEVTTSSIVREISHQDPKDLRIRRRAQPLTDAPVYELLSQRLSGVRERLLRFSERSTYAPTNFFPAKTILGDCRTYSTYKENDIDEGSIDAIVTSPPYATALPYIDTDRLSILLLFGLNSKNRAILEASLVGSREINKKKKAEIDRFIDCDEMEAVTSRTARKIIKEVRKRNFGSEVGFRRDNTAALLYLYFRDMSVVFQNLDKVLKKGGSAFFVIGDNRTTAGGKEIKIKSGMALQEIGTAIGWDLVDVLPITVTTENRLHAKNCITENEIIWFKKKYH